MTTDFITMTEMDYNRISDIVEDRAFSPFLTQDVAALNHELERARVLDFPEIPTDLVTMNTKFRYANLTDNKEDTITIVYPQMSDASEGRISVTAQLGTALLGLREGDEIDWVFPDGKTKRLRVLEILYQPEASGDLHL